MTAAADKIKIHFEGDADDVTFNHAPVDKVAKGQATYQTVIENKPDVFEGFFKNGARNGNGKYTFGNPDAKGATYSGSFENGVPVGEGTFTYPDGSNYVGEFSNGLKNGQGVYTYANGDVFCGVFLNGKKHGHGIYTSASTQSQVDYCSTSSCNSSLSEIMKMDICCLDRSGSCQMDQSTKEVRNIFFEAFMQTGKIISHMAKGNGILQTEIQSLDHILGKINRLLGTDKFAKNHRRKQFLIHSNHSNSDNRDRMKCRGKFHHFSSQLQSIHRSDMSIDSLHSLYQTRNKYLEFGLFREEINSLD